MYNYVFYVQCTCLFTYSVNDECKNKGRNYDKYFCCFYKAYNFKIDNRKTFLQNGKFVCLLLFL